MFERFLGSLDAKNWFWSSYEPLEDHIEKAYKGPWGVVGAHLAQKGKNDDFGVWKMFSENDPIMLETWF